MTAKTRYFVIASLLVLTVGLATGLMAYRGDFGANAVASQGQLEELQLVPADAALVAFAEVADIMATPLGQRLHALSPFKTDDSPGSAGAHWHQRGDRHRPPYRQRRCPAGGEPNARTGPRHCPRPFRRR